tara:strand:- start:61 stop:366 length:306 start_codon:yes stop_codon:yes gene_type:complete
MESKNNLKSSHFFYRYVRISIHSKSTMTLPSNGNKLTEKEEKSMRIAIQEGSITAIHPERMEALGAMLVEQLKKDVEKDAPEIQNMKGAGIHWRTDSPLSD